MTSEIGGLGYGFSGYVFDACGLASPDALEYHPMAIPKERSGGGICAIPPGFVAEQSPDIIVSYDLFIESFLQSDYITEYNLKTHELFLKDDREKAIVETPLGKLERNLWGIRNLYIFIRKDYQTYKMPIYDQ